MIDLGLREDVLSRVSSGWRIVKKNNIFMQELVMDMLTYSKEREPEYERSDIKEMIESLISLFKTKADENNVRLNWIPNVSLGAVDVDPKGIKRCLLNLISNAIDACMAVDDGCVNVSVDIIDDVKYCISISDNGCGIQEEDRKKLFQMFYSTKGSKGTGLGLVVTHKIITEHNGSIEVDSTPGKGTTFNVILPRYKL